MSLSGPALPLAQVEIEERTGESCVAEGGFCPDWIIENFDRYTGPLLEHIFLTAASVGAGFVIAFLLALAAHRQGWLIGPISGITGVLYTIPSISFFFLLIPVTGRGNLSAIIALTAYTLLILFRNTMTGLANVPADAKDAGRGMGLTDRQMLWRVELPLAVPEIMAGLRIATTTTIGLATLAFFAGAGGLGQFLNTPEVFFKSNMIIAGGLAVALAALSDLLILGAQRITTPWRRATATA